MTGSGSPCGACKFLRRKCVKGCVFAPYFCHEQGATHFAAIHKVFGASNVSKLLAHLPVSDRCEAAVTISYEAQARLQDPIYGCVSHIFALQQQVINWYSIIFISWQIWNPKLFSTTCKFNGWSFAFKSCRLLIYKHSLLLWKSKLLKAFSVALLQQNLIMRNIMGSFLHTHKMFTVGFITKKIQTWKEYLVQTFTIKPLQRCPTAPIKMDSWIQTLWGMVMKIQPVQVLERLLTRWVHLSNGVSKTLMIFNQWPLVTFKIHKRTKT